MISLWCSEVYSSLSNVVYRLCGLLLIVAAITLAVYSARAGWSQYSYFRLKYGDLSEAPLDHRQDIATAATMRYPHNYYLSELMAEAFLGAAVNERPMMAEQHYAAALLWSKRGVAQNPYRRNLRWMEAHLTLQDSPETAYILWRDYVEFAFWDPWNIASLLDLALEADRLDDALELLPLLQGTSRYREAKDAVEAASKRLSDGS